MRRLLRAIFLTVLLLTVAPFETPQATAGDGFARYLAQQARFLARASKSNVKRPAAKASTSAQKPGSPQTGQKPNGRNPVAPLTKPNGR
jgi:hypothetical protein